MSDVPVQLIVAAYNDEKAADEAWKTLKNAKWSGIIGIDNMAKIHRDKKNKIHIKEQGDPGGGKGAAIGTVVGGVIGAIAGPLGAVVVGGAAGAVVGGITSKYFDSGIPNDRLKEIGEALQPETSAIVAIIEHKWVAELEEELEDEAADVFVHGLTADIAEQLAEGKDVSFTAVASEDGVAMERVAGNEDGVEMSSIVATEDGITAEAIVANKDGVAFAEAVITEEGAAFVEGVVTEKGAIVDAVIVTDDAIVAAEVIAIPEEASDDLDDAVSTDASDKNKEDKSE